MPGAMFPPTTLTGTEFALVLGERQLRTASVLDRSLWAPVLGGSLWRHGIAVRRSQSIRQRKPMWLVVVSTASPWRAAGR
jgi:hypothetical protein